MEIKNDKTLLFKLLPPIHNIATIYITYFHQKTSFYLHYTCKKVFYEENRALKVQSSKLSQRPHG